VGRKNGLRVHLFPGMGVYWIKLGIESRRALWQEINFCSATLSNPPAQS